MSVKQGKRFVPLTTYCKQTGLSYATVDHGCNTGQIKFITTESGLRRIDTQDNLNTDAAAIVNRLDEQERLLRALCGHLGVR